MVCISKSLSNIRHTSRVTLAGALDALLAGSVLSFSVARGLSLTEIAGAERARERARRNVTRE